MYRFKVGDRVNYGGCEQVLEYRGLFKGEHMAEHVEDTGNGMPFSHIPTKYTGLYWTIHEDETWTKIEGEDTPKPKFKVGDRVVITSAQGKGTAFADTHNGLEVVIESIGGEQDNDNYLNKTGKHWYNTSKYGCIWDVNVDYVVEAGCNSCEVNSDNVGEMLGRAKRYLECGNVNRGLIGELQGYSYYNAFNEPSNSSGNKVGKIMSKLTNFVKNSLLSADEKLLRKNGLKDSCGDYTMEAQELVIAKLIKDNEAYLIEVALAMEAEEKKNK